MNKSYLILEDDTEIKGNGLGHPLFRQYLPCKRYVELLEKYSIKSTFFIDMAHYLFIKDNSSFSDFKLQLKIIDELISLLINKDMDIQLHLHSQWVNAEIIGDEIFVTNKWNISQLKKEEKKKLINRSIKVLKSILKKNKINNDLVSFKAGSWGLQPIKHIYDYFNSNNIKLLLGPTSGLKIPSLDINYNNMKITDYPYYCDRKDVCSIGREREIIILPLTPTYLSWADLIRYWFYKKFNTDDLKNIDTNIDISTRITNNNPIVEKNKFSFKWIPHKTHLKINDYPFWLMKKTFDRSYYKIPFHNGVRIFTIETHTKFFHKNLHEIDKFFKYLKSTYPELEFITISQLFEKIKNGEINPIYNG